MERLTSPGGAYGVQVLIAGRQKHWRDEVTSQIRRAGFAATTVDCGIDAMTVLALGLPVDVLVTDVSLQGKLCCQKLALEARALRPDLRIVFASDLESLASEDDPTQWLEELFDAQFPDDRDGLIAVRRIDNVASTVRDALRSPA
ncbi:histidine kinase [Methylobacterium sp. V23]|uniref:histidine kinase n=1 Tax=Methylobacterium sp. V23 TaxID=2044878 RepID=UPI000CDB9DD3|nr:histidine kinase [Methylobacterium sp. V23]POR44815.1 histidine kinase [Methylobacterium sp. V23]